MRDRLKDWQSQQPTTLISNDGEMSEQLSAELSSDSTFISDNKGDAINALLSLGYKQVQADKAVKQAVETTNTTYTNGARMGMIFNNVVKLYIANDMSWTTDEFVNNFKRVEAWVEACENPKAIPQASKPNEPVAQESVQINDDDLPF